MGMPAAPVLVGAQRPVPGTLAQWAEGLSRSRAGRRGGVLRFALNGRVSTEDWQDPVTSRARQLQQALMQGQ
jgi:site-specific DNA recombinase